MGFVAGPRFPQQLAIRCHYFSNEDSHKDLTRFLAARLWFLGWISRRVKGELIRVWCNGIKSANTTWGLGFCGCVFFLLLVMFFYTERTMIPPFSLIHTHTHTLTDLYFIVAQAIQSAAPLAHSVSGTRVCAGATLLTVYYSPHKMRTLCAKCHVHWLPRDHRLLGENGSRSTAQKKREPNNPSKFKMEL